MIFIREIDLQNVFDVCDLTTNKDGVGTVMEQYLCCNAVSLAEAKYDLEMHPWALYEGDRPVGFFMYRRTEKEPGTATICRFMIDHAHQGRGLGRESFRRMLDHLKSQGIQRAVIMVDDTNDTAKHLYTSFGFAFTGKVHKGEHYYELDLSKCQEDTP